MKPKQQRQQRVQKPRPEKHIYRGAEILREQIMKQLDEMEDQIGAATPRKQRSIETDSWFSQFPDADFGDDDDEKKFDSYDYDREVEEFRHGIAPCEWSVDADNPVTTSTSDLSQSYRLQSSSGPVKKTKRNNNRAKQRHLIVDEDEDIQELTMSEVIDSLYDDGDDDKKETLKAMLLDDPEHFNPEHLTFTFTDEDGAQVPIISPEEKRQDLGSNGAFSDFRGDKDQNDRIIQELRGDTTGKSSSRSQEQSRRPRQRSDVPRSPVQPANRSSGDRQTTPLRHRTQQIYTQRSQSPPPIRKFAYRQGSVPRPQQQRITTPQPARRKYGGAGGFLARHKSAPRQGGYRQHEEEDRQQSANPASDSKEESSYLPSRLDAKPKSLGKWRPSKQKLFAGKSLLDQDESVISSDVSSPRHKRSRRKSKTQERKATTEKKQSYVQVYEKLMSDPAYVHAMKAGFLWQSLVGQHMKFPSWWWSGGRGPTMGDGASVSRPWVYLGRQSVLDNFVLQKLVKSRASGGRLLLHIVIQDAISKATTIDIALGCFHPNAKEVRDTQQALRHLETCRDVWISMRKHAEHAPSALDTILYFPDRSSRSPLGPGGRVNNNNVRAVFGEKPPLETLFMTEEEVRRRLAPRIVGKGETAPLAVLQEFVFA